MELETITDTPDLLIRRMTLAAGEAMYWHSDACRRFTVVVRGTRLGIEYRDGECVEFAVAPGEVGWDEPEARVHRAVNLGDEPYEEVVTFYRDAPNQVPQPRA